MRDGESRAARGERGAALVEYMLLVALGLIVAMAAIDTIRTAADDHMARTGDDVGGSDELASDDPADPDDPGGPGTTTTLPPGPIAAAAGFTGTDSWMSGWSWYGSAIVRVTGAGGAPLAGVEVEVRVTPAGGDPVTVVVTTDDVGRAVVSVGPYSTWWRPVDEVDLSIEGVSGDGVIWDGGGDDVTVHRP